MFAGIACVGDFCIVVLAALGVEPILAFSALDVLEVWVFGAVAVARSFPFDGGRFKVFFLIEKLRS